MLLEQNSKVAGKRVSDLQMPEGSLLISVLREGGGSSPAPTRCSSPATRFSPCSTRVARRT